MKMKRAESAPNLISSPLLSLTALSILRPRRNVPFAELRSVSMNEPETHDRFITACLRETAGSLSNRTLSLSLPTVVARRMRRHWRGPNWPNDTSREKELSFLGPRETSSRPMERQLFRLQVRLFAIETRLRLPIAYKQLTRRDAAKANRSHPRDPL